MKKTYLLILLPFFFAFVLSQQTFASRLDQVSDDPSNGSVALQTSTSQPVRTATSSPTVSPAIVTPSPNSDIYFALANHFESVSNLILTVNAAFTGLFTILAGVATVFGIRFTLNLAAQRKQLKEMGDEQQKLNESLEKAQANVQAIVDRLNYIREAQDINPEVRMRSIQQLGQTNDVAAISILANRYDEEKDLEVKLEIVHGVASLLIGAEGYSFQLGFKVLTKASIEKNDRLRYEFLDAVNLLVRNKVEIQRLGMQRLREMKEHDTNTLVKETSCGKMLINGNQNSFEGN